MCLPPTRTSIKPGRGCPFYSKGCVECLAGRLQSRRVLWKELWRRSLKKMRVNRAARKVRNWLHIWDLKRQCGIHIIDVNGCRHGCGGIQWASASPISSRGAPRFSPPEVAPCPHGRTGLRPADRCLPGLSLACLQDSKGTPLQPPRPDIQHPDYLRDLADP
jgi:hypothetical protein